MAYCRPYFDHEFLSSFPRPSFRAFNFLQHFLQLSQEDGAFRCLLQQGTDVLRYDGNGFSSFSHLDLTLNWQLPHLCVCVFNIYIYLFSWLGLSCCTQDLWSPLQPVGSRSPTRDGSHAPALGMQSLSHWTTKKSPLLIFSFFLSALSIIFCCTYELKLLFT